MKGYIPTLDGWRAIAILAVMVYHGTTAVFYPAGFYPSYHALRIIQTGAKGVDIFFAISGFLICTRLLQEQHEKGRISLLGFYLRRVFRILPPYFLYLGVLALVAWAGVIVIDQREWWSCVFFYRNYCGDLSTHGWYTGHFWSLAVEEHFYFFWPLLLVGCGSRRLRPLVVVFALLVPVWSLVDQSYHLISVGHPSQRTDTRLDGLFWGCWAALVLDVPRYREWITRWLTPWVWGGGVVVLVALVRYQPPLETHWQAFLMPWLLLGTVLRPTWAMSRLLEFSAVRWVGRLSYSLYIWQQLFLLGSWRETRPFPLGVWQELPLSIGATFACALVSYYFLERPMIRLGQHLARRCTPLTISPVESVPVAVART